MVARAQRERLLRTRSAGTPRYVYDLATVRARARALADAGAIDRCFYAIKANPHPAILRTLVAEGFGLECVSQGELEHVFAVLPGVDPARVLFTPSFAPRAEYEAAFAARRQRHRRQHRSPAALAGAVPRPLDLVAAGSRPRRRPPPEGAHRRQRREVRPAAGSHGRLRRSRRAGSTCASSACTRTSAAAWTWVTHWRDVYAELAALAEGIGTVATIDLGGGMPIPYRADDAPFDVDAWASGLSAIKAAYPGFALAIEPGRYLVAEAGVLLMHVTQVVEKDGVRRIGWMPA